MCLVMFKLMLLDLIGWIWFNLRFIWGCLEILLGFILNVNVLFFFKWDLILMLLFSLVISFL